MRQKQAAVKASRSPGGAQGSRNAGNSRLLMCSNINSVSMCETSSREVNAVIARSRRCSESRVQTCRESHIRFLRIADAAQDVNEVLLFHCHLSLAIGLGEARRSYERSESACRIALAPFCGVGFSWRSQTELGAKRQRSLAEGEGFEPPDGFPSPVFKTGAFVHSAIPPTCELSVLFATPLW